MRRYWLGFSAWLLVAMMTCPGQSSAWESLPKESQSDSVARVKVRPRDESVSLAGKWLLTMSAGFEFDATIEPDDRPNYFVLKSKEAPNLLGVYELKGTRLVMHTPRMPKMVGLEWVVLNNNTLVLVEHPKESQFGSDYRGATLGRQKTIDP
jgi:hypothetical protein